ncbi:MAG: diguanylate cyclase [Candidatus Electrothrix sp. AR5]|nr:diguanylate cyclase [Candidatus Electrothrix sp. AR5]
MLPKENIYSGWRPVPDYFKSGNVTYGYDAGDKVLKGLTGLSRKNGWGSDVIGKIGGKKFAAILPNTVVSHAERAAERLREAVANHRRHN